jgi:hypothetical protein
MQGTKRTMVAGDRVRVIGAYSEVMCHFGLAGKPIEIELVRKEYDGGATVYYSAQVHKDGRPFSGTITTSEGGIYGNERDGFYTYEAAPDEAGDENPRQVMADMTKMLDDAIKGSGVPVLTITDLGLNF